MRTITVFERFVAYREAVKTLAADHQQVAVRRSAIAIRDDFEASLRRGDFDFIFQSREDVQR